MPRSRRYRNCRYPYLTIIGILKQTCVGNSFRSMKHYLRRSLGVGAHLIACLVFATSCVSAQSGYDPMGEEAFDVMLTFLSYDDIDLDARVIGERDFEEFVRYKITYNGSREQRVPVYLAVPKNVSGPVPVVILLHGMPGHKEFWFDDNSFLRGGLVTTALIERGIAVAAPDAPMHGEREAYNDYRNPLSIWSDYTDTLDGYRLLMQRSTIETRRLIDYLETHEAIDGNRIGVLGYSMGGQTAVYTAAADDRVRVTVSCVPGATSPPLFGPIEFAPRLTEPFLLLHGNQDVYTPVDQVRALYTAVGSDTKDVEIYDTGHRLPPEYATRAGDWFERHF